MNKEQLKKQIVSDIFKTPKLKKERYTGSKQINKEDLSRGYIKINATKRNNSRNS
jgi:hypothetical protein